MFKRIYIEITNQCNLNCSFCIHNQRKPKFLNITEFKEILNKVKPYTKYLYFHLLGEPLLHPLINEFIDEAMINFKVNITTNGYLINQLNTKNIRQLNISLHSFDPIYGKTVEEYITDIINKCDSLFDTYIVYRFWVEGRYNNEIMNILNIHYNQNIDFTNNKGNYQISDKIYVSFEKSFMWPNIENNLNIEQGFCQAINDHLGILVDGTVVPCCLDSKGDISLGNIFNTNLDYIINDSRYTNLKNNFHNNKRCELLCKNCSYKITNEV